MVPLLVNVACESSVSPSSSVTVIVLPAIVKVPITPPVANLEGTYDLNLNSTGVMTLDDDVDLEVTMGVLTLDANTFAFTLTATGGVMGTFTIARNTITFTDDGGEPEDSQATLTNNGTTLTLIDEDDDTLIFDKR